MNLPLITVSEVKTFRRCQRLHYYRYILGYSPRERAEALRFGTLIHTGLEHWWGTAGDLDAAEAAIRSAASNPFELAKAEEMMRGYHYRWIGETITVMAVEHEFRVALVHPDTGATSRAAEFGGKFDALCEIDGKVYLPEHKTSGEDIDEGSTYWRALKVDVQISGYLIAAQALGHDPGGVVYDVIAKPKVDRQLATPIEARKYRKDGGLYAMQRDADETPDEYRDRVRSNIIENVDSYYKRVLIPRSTEQLREAALDIWDAAEAIHGARAAHYHPRNTDACRSFGRMCEFWDVCESSSRQEVLESDQFIKLRNPHQELSHATSEGSSTELARKPGENNARINHTEPCQ